MDLHDDGLLDLVFVTSTGGGGLALLPGLGNGVFGTTQLLSLSSEPIDVAAGDLNGDGVVDLAAVDSRLFAAQVSVLLGLGDGGLGPVQPFAVVGKTFVLGDVDGDSDLDIVSSSYSKYSLMLNQSQ
ncbi:MAG: hypothetical protein ACI9EF_003853 [Pseudohongiellaceae bacterium]|jgi:hypothetical protein